MNRGPYFPMFPLLSEYEPILRSSQITDWTVTQTAKLENQRRTRGDDRGPIGRDGSLFRKSAYSEAVPVILDPPTVANPVESLLNGYKEWMVDRSQIPSQEHQAKTDTDTPPVFSKGLVNSMTHSDQSIITSTFKDPNTNRDGTTKPAIVTSVEMDHLKLKKLSNTKVVASIPIDQIQEGNTSPDHKVATDIVTQSRDLPTPDRGIPDESVMGTDRVTACSTHGHATENIGNPQVNDPASREKKTQQQPIVTFLDWQPFEPAGDDQENSPKSSGEQPLANDASTAKEDHVVGRPPAGGDTSHSDSGLDRVQTKSLLSESVIYSSDTARETTGHNKESLLEEKKRKKLTSTN